MAAVSTSDFEAAKQQQERAQREKMFYTAKTPDSSCRPFDAREEIKDLRNKLNMLEARVMQDSTPKPDMSVEDMMGVLIDAIEGSGGAIAGVCISTLNGGETYIVDGHIDMRALAESVLKAVK
ncbi:hypothetical protein [Ponticaulis profundi]|uniref:Uncharacterized protein n=1 Tax=Ponticaulis profundi TaxID=2665222 RepID=A0ABW1S8E7_9PROT